MLLLTICVFPFFFLQPIRPFRGVRQSINSFPAFGSWLFFFCGGFCRATNTTTFAAGRGLKLCESASEHHRRSGVCLYRRA
uniref:Putative secreted protein n=1 Tax=Anopheles darlingi TaxID=43151 RepID=A0A2M4DDS1_ANODA